MPTQIIFPINRRAKARLKKRYYTLEAALMENVGARIDANTVECGPRGRAYSRLYEIENKAIMDKAKAFFDRVAAAAEQNTEISGD